MTSHYPDAAVNQAVPSADDFTQIKGIGRAMNERLHARGIYTFAQLASLTPAEVAQMVRGVIGRTAENISQENWIGQAEQLADRRQEPGELITSPERDELSPYARFVLDLLITEDRQVRRTRITHIKSGAEREWGGWDVDRLVRCMADWGGLALSETPALQPGSSQTSSTPRYIAAHPLTEAPVLSHLESVASDGTPCLAVPAGQPISVRLIADARRLGLAGPDKITGRAIVYAKNVTDRSRLPIAESLCLLNPNELTVVNLEGMVLHCGAYRLEALLTVTHTPGDQAEAYAYRAFIEGNRLQVY